jgi:hypothetical protein
MIKELAGSEGSVLAVQISGKVTLEQENELIDKANRIVEAHGKIRVLAVLEDGAKWGVKAGIEDLKWAVSHMKNIDRFAVVSSSNVWKWLITIDGFFAGMMGIGEKHFQTAEIEDAWQWIRE